MNNIKVGDWVIAFNTFTRNQTTIHMTKQNSVKFKAWLKEFKPEGLLK